MRWYNVKERMPQDNEKVVVYYTRLKDKCIDIATFKKGISRKEREILKNQNNDRANYICPWDEWENNSILYGWIIQYHSNNLSGEEIEWWCPLSEFPFPE